jgi:hypothetical protein
MSETMLNIMFYEICIYEAKLDKQDEIEELMKEVAAFYKGTDGIKDVRYIKRTHRQEDFNSVKEGVPPVRLTRYVGKVTYVLILGTEDEKAHGDLAKAALPVFYKRWTRCLTTMPKIILGTDIFDL